jgi:hypothetical protein
MKHGLIKERRRTVTETSINEPIQVRIIPETGDIRKQLIFLGISAVAAVGMIWLERKLSGPDAFLTMKMKGFAAVQDYADKRAAFWHDVARRAANAYLDSRP